MKWETGVANIHAGMWKSHFTAHNSPHYNHIFLLAVCCFIAHHYTGHEVRFWTSCQLHYCLTNYTLSTSSTDVLAELNKVIQQQFIRFLYAEIQIWLWGIELCEVTVNDTFLLVLWRKEKNQRSRVLFWEDPLWAHDIGQNEEVNGIVQRCGLV